MRAMHATQSRLAGSALCDKHRKGPPLQALGYLHLCRQQSNRHKRQRLEAVAEGQLVRWLDLPPDKVLATEDNDEGPRPSLTAVRPS